MEKKWEEMKSILLFVSLNIKKNGKELEENYILTFSLEVTFSIPCINILFCPFIVWYPKQDE